MALAQAEHRGHPHASPVAVTMLALNQFRSWPAVRLAVDARPVVLTGDNGTGKTNLLEALSYLSPGRGLRGARLSDLARQGGNSPWAVSADVATATGPLRVGTGADPEALSERRVVRIDGHPARGPSALAEHLSMIWLTPAMDGLFRDSSSGRRRFFDRLVYAHDPLHARRIGAYERTMRERARLLKEGRREPAWLDALEETMSETGVAVAAARRDLVDRLAPLLAEDYGPFPGCRAELSGALERDVAAMPAVEAEQRFRAALAASRARDAETGGAAEGPHRTDLAVTHLASGMAAELCSTGQQKSLVVALLLAAARLEATRRPPVLLLDDVAAHLDEAHRTALFGAVLELGLQAWMTGTETQAFTALHGRAQFFRIAEGRIDATDGQQGQDR